MSFNHLSILRLEVLCPQRVNWPTGRGQNSHFFGYYLFSIIFVFDFCSFCISFLALFYNICKKEKIYNEGLHIVVAIKYWLHRLSCLTKSLVNPLRGKSISILKMVKNRRKLHKLIQLFTKVVFAEI